MKISGAYSSLISLSSALPEFERQRIHFPIFPLRTSQKGTELCGLGMESAYVDSIGWLTLAGINYQKSGADGRVAGGQKEDVSRNRWQDVRDPQPWEIAQDTSKILRLHKCHPQRTVMLEFIPSNIY